MVGAPAAIAIIATRKVMVAMCGFGKERRWEALGRINGRTAHVQIHSGHYL